MKMNKKIKSTLLILSLILVILTTDTIQLDMSLENLKNLKKINQVKDKFPSDKYAEAFEPKTQTSGVVSDINDAAVSTQFLPNIRALINKVNLNFAKKYLDDILSNTIIYHSVLLEKQESTADSKDIEKRCINTFDYFFKDYRKKVKTSFNYLLNFYTTYKANNECPEQIIFSHSLGFSKKTVSFSQILDSYVPYILVLRDRLAKLTERADCKKYLKGKLEFLKFASTKYKIDKDHHDALAECYMVGKNTSIYNSKDIEYLDLNSIFLGGENNEQAIENDEEEKIN